MVFNGQQEKESINCVRLGHKNCPSGSLFGMTIGDPLDSFFYPILTLVIDSYTVNFENFMRILFS